MKKIINRIAVGFTGTQKGMSQKQISAIQKILIHLPVACLHHGDCIGADAQIHQMAKKLDIQIVIHPPDDPRKRAYCQGSHYMAEKPYLIRNHNIVNSSDLLIAAPKEHQEILRSGTWATIRYGKKQNKKIQIFYP
jgi:hypothetical protein